MNITGKIPVKPHLKKFALWLENKGEGEAIDLVEGSIVAYMLGAILTGKTQLKLDKSVKLHNEYSETISYTVNVRRLNRGELFVSEANVIVFNRFLHKQFHECLLQRIQRNHELDIREKDTILKFMDMCGIDEDDISFDGIKKANYRLRKDKNIPVFSRPKRPPAKYRLPA